MTGWKNNDWRVESRRCVKSVGGNSWKLQDNFIHFSFQSNDNDSKNAYVPNRAKITEISVTLLRNDCAIFLFCKRGTMWMYHWPPERD